MRECFLEFVYEHPWHSVVKAYQCRFGNLPHPKLPALSSADLTSASYNKERQQLSWTLGVEIEPTVATWIKRLSGVWSCRFRTENTLNFQTKTLTITNTNEQFRNIAVVEETNVFRVHDERSDWTIYEQHSKLQFCSMLGLRGRFEDAIMKSYTKNYNIGRSLDIEYLQMMLVTGEPERGFLENLALQMLADQTLLRCIPFMHEENNESEVGRELVISTTEHTQVDTGIVVRADPISL